MEESREGEDLQKKTQNKKSHDPFPLKIWTPSNILQNVKLFFGKHIAILSMWNIKAL
jgi:hypothetical protein